MPNRNRPIKLLLQFCLNAGAVLVDIARKDCDRSNNHDYEDQDGYDDISNSHGRKLDANLHETSTQQYGRLGQADLSGSICGLSSGLRLYQKHMALARPPIPASIDPFRTLKQRRLAISAIVVAALCSLAAFICLVWRDQGRPRVMINEQSAPGLVTQAGKVASASQQTGFNKDVAQTKLPEPVNPAMKPFSISKASGVAPLGPVELRLIDTNPASKLYDVNVIAGGRSYSHRHLKADQPLWIAGRKGSGAIELIVKLVQDDAITGYWTESNRLAHVSSRRRLAHK